MKKKWYWHTYYVMLAEFLSEKEYQGAISHFQKEATSEEVDSDISSAAKLRLKLIKPVKGSFPKALVDAYKLYDEAWVLRFEKQWKEFLKVQDIFSSIHDILYESKHSNEKLAIEVKNLYEKATDAYFVSSKKIFEKLCNTYYKVRDIYDKEVRRLHEEECPNCSWKNARII